MNNLVTQHVYIYQNSHPMKIGMQGQSLSHTEKTVRSVKKLKPHNYTVSLLVTVAHDHCEITKHLHANLQ